MKSLKSNLFLVVMTIVIMAVVGFGCSGDNGTLPDPNRLVLSHQQYNITLLSGLLLKATGGEAPISWSSSGNIRLETPPPQDALEGNRAVRVFGVSLGEGWVEARSADNQTARARIIVQ